MKRKHLCMHMLCLKDYEINEMKNIFPHFPSTPSFFDLNFFYPIFSQIAFFTVSSCLLTLLLVVAVLYGDDVPHNRCRCKSNLIVCCEKDSNATQTFLLHRKFAIRQQISKRCEFSALSVALLCRGKIEKSNIDLKTRRRDIHTSNRFLSQSK